MDHKTLLGRLNWFYSLEVTQVDNYLAQSRAVDDPYIATGLERVALIEQGHVDNISKIIINLGSKPSMLGELLSPVLGTTLGKVLGTTDVVTILKANIKIEALAVTDYQKLIRELQSSEHDREILKTLQHTLLDEDLHTSWFAHVLELMDDSPWPLSPALAGKPRRRWPKRLGTIREKQK